MGSSPTAAKIWMVKYPGKKYVSSNPKVPWSDEVPGSHKKSKETHRDRHRSSRLGKNHVRVPRSRRKTIPADGRPGGVNQTHCISRRGSWVPPGNSGDENGSMDQTNVRYPGWILHFFENKTND